MADTPLSEMEKFASSQRSDNIFSDFWYFFRNSKKWWLLPIIVFMLIAGVLMMLSITAVAPFIYAIF